MSVGNVIPLREAMEDLRPGHRALPGDVVCPTCGYFHAEDRRVSEILLGRDPTGRLLEKAQCRCRRRREVAEGVRLENANLPFAEARTWASFKGNVETAGMLSAARQFARLGGPPVLVISGPVGVGKSHILEAIGRECLEADRTVRYEMVGSLLERLRHTYSSKVEMDAMDLMNWYDSFRILLLDDLGLEKSTEWAIEKLTTLVDRRLRKRRRLAVATNLTEADVTASLGPRLGSRLFGDNGDLDAVRVVWVMGRDYRKGSNRHQ